MALDCLDVADFLAWESHNFPLKEDDLIERMERACKSARALMSAIQGKERQRITRRSTRSLTLQVNSVSYFISTRNPYNPQISLM